MATLTSSMPGDCGKLREEENVLNVKLILLQHTSVLIFVDNVAGIYVGERFTCTRLIECYSTFTAFPLYLARLRH